jgi:transcription-repair coupling factor (superfamily II helicase)
MGGRLLPSSRGVRRDRFRKPRHGRCRRDTQGMRLSPTTPPSRFSRIITVSPLRPIVAVPAASPTLLRSANPVVAALSLALPAWKPGDRVQLPPCSGSSDALLVAQLAAKGQGLLAVVAASAGDAQRLLDEIPWFAPGLRVRLLPDWETLPYDSFSPHHDLVSERLATLYSVMRGECDVLLVPASTAAYRFAPPSYLAAYTFFLKQGDRLDAEAFRAQMTLAGYTHVSNVVSPGEYSVRGGLVDLYPMGSALPYRIDLFDDEIESVKTFDVDTQRTLYPVPEIRLLPAREFPMDEKGRAHFRQRFREAFEGDPAKSGIYKDVSSGIPSAGIEYWLPLFFDATATLFDYLPKEASLCLLGDVPAALRDFWRDARSRHEMLSGEKSRPLLAPGELFLDEEAFFLAAKPHARLLLAKGDGGPTAAVPPVAVDRRADDPLARLKSFIDTFAGRILLLAESAGRRETLAGLFAEYGIKPGASADLAGFLADDSRLALGVAPLHEGFLLDGLAFVTEAELYAGSAAHPPRRAEEGLARQLAARPDRAQGRRSGGARAARHRPLPGPDPHGPRRRRHRIPRTALRRRRQALRAGLAVARHLALFGRRSGRRAAAYARLAAMGKGQEESGIAGARHGRRTARALRPPRGAPGPRLRVHRARL